MKARLFIIIVALLVYFLSVEHYYVFVPVVFFTISYNLILIILDFVNKNKHKRKNIELNQSLMVMGYVLFLILMFVSNAQMIIGLYTFTNILLVVSFLLFVLVILYFNQYYDFYYKKFSNIAGIIVLTTLSVISLGWTINNLKFTKNVKVKQEEVWNTEKVSSRTKGGHRHFYYYIHIKTPYGMDRFEISKELYYEIFPNDSVEITIRKGLLGFDKIEKIENNK